MDKKHFISLTLLFLFTISVFSTAAFAKDYSIPSLNMDLFHRMMGPCMLMKSFIIHLQGLIMEYIGIYL